ncbi:MAG TPA: HAMP domain-containing histidine kinase [Candidatus Ornithoclostridium excrementipullorum]|nr:HAMP domain-containing histidine kinase [Candidatus Ornithoclostridium excrementipullorum]
METVLAIAICVAAVCAAAALALSVKTIAVRRTLADMADTLEEAEDSNVVVRVRTRDKAVRAAAEALNDELTKLRKARSEYSQGSRDLDTAIVNMAHDLRTPLTAALGWLELCDKTDDPVKLHGYAQAARDAATRLKELTEELFGYALAHEKEKPEFDRADLTEALRRAVLASYAAFGLKGVEPKIDLPDAPVWAISDCRMLERIFDNIISNALKYGKDGFFVSLDEKGVVKIGNNCEGLDSVDVARMFDRFFTVKNARSSSGLGLSIAKTLTARLGGKIYADLDKDVLTVTVDFSQTLCEIAREK